MPPSTAAAEDLDELHELNRLFLQFLTTRLRDHSDGFGLSGPTAALLKHATDSGLETLAAFPRALFRLRVGAIHTTRAFDPGPGPDERWRQALNLTVLHSAWNMSRRSSYRARLFLWLDESDVAVLRATPLSDLPAASAGTDVVTCGFVDAPWFWQQLLTESRPESRRQLLLIGLQPQIRGPDSRSLQKGLASA